MLSLNHMILHEIDNNPTGTAAYQRIGDGISSANYEGNEKVDSKSYLNDNGGETSNVTGGHPGWTFAGDRITGDAAQDEIVDMLTVYGSDRKRLYRDTFADGRVLSGTVNVSEISPASGAAAEVSALGFKCAYDGLPTNTAPVAATALGAVIAVGTTAIPSTKATVAAPTAGAHLAYKITPAASGLQTANNRQYVNPAEIVLYTSGDDIAGVVAGQYLSVYEIDAMDHLVKFLCEALEAGDIKSA